MKRIIRQKRGAFEMSFGMLFAIIAGAVIIFLAIYATTKFVQTTKQVAYTEAAVSLSNLMNPIVNGITSAFATSIDFRKDTRIYLNCSTETGKSPYFGAETIGFSEQSGLVAKWTEPEIGITRNNKYIFSEAIEQGKKLTIFAVPFYLGYRVDDLIMTSMGDYCFVSAPSFIGEEIGSLGIENINITARIDQCKPNSIKVCFGFLSGACDIAVEGDCNEDYCKSQYDTGRIVKSGKTIYYAKNLIYAGIFASPEIYECNIKRLGRKAAELGEVYKEKIGIVELKECNTAIGPYIDGIAAIAGNLSMSQLANIYYQASLMDEQNCNNMQCRIYAPGPGACFS